MNKNTPLQQMPKLKYFFNQIVKDACSHIKYFPDGDQCRLFIKNVQAGTDPCQYGFAVSFADHYELSSTSNNLTSFSDER